MDTMALGEEVGLGAGQTERGEHSLSQSLPIPGSSAIKETHNLKKRNCSGKPCSWLPPQSPLIPQMVQTVRHTMSYNSSPSNSKVWQYVSEAKSPQIPLGHSQKVQTPLSRF